MKFFKLLLLCLTASSMLLAEAKTATAFNPVYSAIENLPMIKVVNGKVDKLEDYGNIYQFRAFTNTNGENGMIEAFVTKDFKTLILGKGYGENGDELSIALDNITKAKDIVAFSAGKGANEYYAFIDPTCGPCKVYEKQLGLLSEDAKVNFIFFSMDFEDSRKAIYHIMSQKDDDLKLRELQKIAYGSQDFKLTQHSTEDIAKYDAYIEKARNVAINSLYVSSTPVLLDTKGNRQGWIKTIDIEKYAKALKNNVKTTYKPR